jgi:hypothetical protein
MWHGIECRNALESHAFSDVLAADVRLVQHVGVVAGDVTGTGASDGERATRTARALLTSEEGTCSWLADLDGLDVQTSAATIRLL